MKPKWKNIGHTNGRPCYELQLPNKWSVEVRWDANDRGWLWVVFQNGRGRTPFVAGSYRSAKAAMRSFDRFAVAIKAATNPPVKP